MGRYFPRELFSVRAHFPGVTFRGGYFPRGKCLALPYECKRTLSDESVSRWIIELGFLRIILGFL